MLGTIDEFALLTPGWDEVIWMASVGERHHARSREESRDPVRRRETRATWLAANRDRLRAYYAERYLRLKGDRPDKRRGKLSAEQVEQVRSLAGRVSAREAGRRFGITHSQVVKIWRGEAWTSRNRLPG